ALTEGECGAAEERVDRGTVTVLVRAADDAKRAVDDEEVMVGRRDVDAVRLERGTVPCLLGGKAPRALEDLGQVAALARRGVEDDEHRCTEVLGQTGDDALQRLDSTGRGAECNHGAVAVPIGHSRGVPTVPPRKRIRPRRPKKG